MNMETIWQFKTRRFRVVLAWEWEDYPDISWDDTGEVRAKLESGEWGNYAFSVKVYCDGREIAADYLGNSIYADPKEFRDHFGRKKNGVSQYGSYFSDMVFEAISEARKALSNVPRLRNAAIMRGAGVLCERE
jgi:hypothetical protein